MDYNYKDLLRAYAQAGVERGRVVLLASDLRWLGCYQKPDREAFLGAHFQAIAELIDLEDGTLVVSTPSIGLCNTDTPFDPANTPSDLGVLNEFIRTRPGAVRSLHPFTSYTAVGRHAHEICSHVSRHSFGPHTPIARMMDLNTRCISLGVHPRKTCSEVHHCEFVMGVPYRYVKEFMHPVVINGSYSTEPFYMYVWYRELELHRDGNRKIFEHFRKHGGVTTEADLGRGTVYGYELAHFVESTLDLMRCDIYAWLERPPQIRPYRN